MSMQDETTEPSPFTRPGFIAAAGVVALLVVLGLVVAIANGDPDREPAAVPAASPTGTPALESGAGAPADAGEDSVCGLAAAESGTTLPVAPEATWQFQGTTAYPISEEFGPGQTREDGVRYCFQRSPQGALFAAANAVVQGSTPATVGPWLNYVLAAGPHRDTVLAAGAGTATDGSGARLEIDGFRLLSYNDQTARVDVAVRGTANGQAVILSMVYLLVWEGGDWKLSVTDPTSPIDVAVVPDLAGYIAWGANA